MDRPGYKNSKFSSGFPAIWNLRLAQILAPILSDRFDCIKSCASLFLIWNGLAISVTKNCTFLNCKFHSIDIFGMYSPFNFNLNSDSIDRIMWQIVNEITWLLWYTWISYENNFSKISSKKLTHLKWVNLLHLSNGTKYMACTLQHILQYFTECNWSDMHNFDDFRCDCCCCFCIEFSHWIYFQGSFH